VSFSGCAIYTGQETKISLNSRYASHKYSQVERLVTNFIISTRVKISHNHRNHEVQISKALLCS